MYVFEHAGMQEHGGAWNIVVRQDNVPVLDHAQSDDFFERRSAPLEKLLLQLNALFYRREPRLVHPLSEKKRPEIELHQDHLVELGDIEHFIRCGGSTRMGVLHDFRCAFHQLMNDAQGLTSLFVRARVDSLNSCKLSINSSLTLASLR